MDSKEFHEFTVKKSSNGAITPQDLKKYEIEGGWCIDEKYDGSFYICRIHPQGLTTFTSRRISAKDGHPIEKRKNVPQFMNAPKDLEHTLLLGEIIAPTGMGFNESSGVMNMLPEKAVEWQRVNGLLRYVVFDCLWYKGKDVRDKIFGFRHDIACNVVDHWKNKNIILSQTVERFFQPTYQQIVSRGGEGVMLKKLDAPYGKGVLKCKKEADVSVVITGFTKGSGKYEGKIGAIKFSVFTQAGLQEIGQCSGMTDEMRDIITEDKDKLQGKVMDVTCQPIDNPKLFTPGDNRLRHPRFVKFRTDVASIECTLEKLKKDLSFV